MATDHTVHSASGHVLNYALQGKVADDKVRFVRMKSSK
jgi:hypothetical protein